MDAVEIIVVGTLISYGIWGILFMKKFIDDGKDEREVSGKAYSKKTFNNK